MTENIKTLYLDSIKITLAVKYYIILLERVFGHIKIVLTTASTRADVHLVVLTVEIAPVADKTEPNG